MSCFSSGISSGASRVSAPSPASGRLFQSFIMANTVLGVGYTLASNTDDFAFDALAKRLDEAEALGVDFVELPLYAMDLIAGARVLGNRLKLAKARLAGRPLRYTVHGAMAINLMDVPERL